MDEFEKAVTRNRLHWEKTPQDQWYAGDPYLIGLGLARLIWTETGSLPLHYYVIRNLLPSEEALTSMRPPNRAERRRRR